MTADQIAAQQIGQDTVLPSIELAIEDHSGLIGACDRDYGCIHMNTLLAHSHNPAQGDQLPQGFEQMFGSGGSAADRAARAQEDRSILNAITHRAADLQRSLGVQDRATMSDYPKYPRDRAAHSKGQPNIVSRDAPSANY